MADLEQFPPDKYHSLIALPYRVGLFISESDKTGGSDANARELAALENVVTFYVEDTLKSDFAQEIMLATLQHKTYWKEWGAAIGDVPAECRDIMDYLKDRVDSRKLLAFKNNLLEIATAVAMAYRETGASPGFIDRFKNIFLPEKKTASSSNPYINISADEKTAINRLAEIFDVNYRIG